MCSSDLEDYGLIINETLYPATGTIEISGSSANREIQSYPYVASGITTLSGDSNKVIHYVPAYPGSGIINISGRVKDSTTPATYIASGSGQFSSIAGKSVESVVYNPPDKTVNAVISGAGSVKFNRRRSYTGIGTVNIKIGRAHV